MARGSIVHFLTHTGAPVKGCDACDRGEPRGRDAKAGEIFASMASVRDSFAQTALQAIILASPPYADPDAAGRLAFKYADAAMVARGPVPSGDAGGQA